MKNFACTIIIFFLLALSGTALGWHDKTHLAVAKAAKYPMWYNAAGPDIAKIKAGDVEGYNHWYNNNWKAEVTPQTVINQISRYNKANVFLDSEGHLYGAIIASLREYEATIETGKYAEYHLVYCAHYVGDLSMPLHNTPYDDFNMRYHAVNDGIVDQEVLEHSEKIEKHMYMIALRDSSFEDDLIREIVRIANISRLLGYKLQAESRNMTPEEAYRQLGHSSSLLKAVLQHYKKTIKH
ncbi:MAG: hypothetical protein CVU52_03915 [Deltaproteobacteria bacterium HGW-Deltaproteobacteria-10]|nr:MAG: hypothetical protein CVU52_03915 [Deltaproteobacteria bacterium HGW-Deltaproteobacteria-10]